MKQSLFLIVSVFLLINFANLIIPSRIYAAHLNNPTESQPESGKVSTPSTSEDTSTLIEIYGKIRHIAGNKDSSELRPYLHKLNEVLDEVLSFKNSFTPEKKKKLEKQLNQVKKEVVGLEGLEVSQLKGQLEKLSDSLFKLVKVLVES
jgi:hypothetical protein